MEADDAVQALRQIGARPREARRLWSRHFEAGGLASMALPVQIRRPIFEAVVARLAAPSLALVDRYDDPVDAFRKYRFRLADGARIETVSIPIFDSHLVVCVSSQTGCALACEFCATATLGAGRNLSVEEIVEQVLYVQHHNQRPVRGVVFMGMGEPLLNLEAVQKAIRVLSAGGGPQVSGDAITLSTAGVLPALEKLRGSRLVPRLVLSVGSARPLLRARLMPIERRYPLAKVFPVAAAIAAERRRRLTLALVMIEGLTTTPEEVAALAKLIEGHRVIFDLIDVNDATGGLRPPSEVELNTFRDALGELGAPVHRRYSGGREVEGACGMLVAGQARARR